MTRSFSPMLHTILAILSMIIGGLSSLTMLVFLLAGGANSTEAQIRQIKWMIAATLVIEALSLAGSIWLLIEHRGWSACAVGLIPLMYAIALVSFLVIVEW